MMRLHLTQRLALFCTVCGRCLDKPEYAADSDDLRDQDIACSGPDNPVLDDLKMQCPKCLKVSASPDVVTRILQYLETGEEEE